MAEIETSKESSELKAGADGIISLKAEEGEDIDVGAVIALMETSDPEAVSSEEAVHEAAETVMPVADNKKVKPKEAVPTFVSGIKGNEIILYGGGGFAETAIDILKVTRASRSCMKRDTTISSTVLTETRYTESLFMKSSRAMALTFPILFI